MKIGKLTKSILAVVAITALALPGIVFAQQDSGTKHGSLGEVGAKLSNPVGDLWALTFSISAPAFFDGDLNTGSPELGGSMSFQPILPIPLAETGMVNGG